MSNFFCEVCGTAIVDSPEGYITGCEHHPIEEKGRKDDQLPDGEMMIKNATRARMESAPRFEDGQNEGAWHVGFASGYKQGYDAGYEAGKKERDDLRAANDRLKADVAKAIDALRHYADKSVWEYARAETQACLYRPFGNGYDRAQAYFIDDVVTS